MLFTKKNAYTDSLHSWGVSGILMSSLMLSIGARATNDVATLLHEPTVYPSLLEATQLPWQQNEMGMALINGNGVKQDIILGRHWIHLAAHQSFPLAQYNLGLMFYDGIGGERNPQCAEWWLQKALNQTQPEDEVYVLAEQALLTLTSQQLLRPHVYRLPSASLCDRGSTNPLMILADSGSNSEQVEEDVLSPPARSFFEISWINLSLNYVKDLWAERPGNTVKMNSSSLNAGTNEVRTPQAVQVEPSVSLTVSTEQQVERDEGALLNGTMTEVVGVTPMESTVEPSLEMAFDSAFSSIDQSSSSETDVMQSHSTEKQRPNETAELDDPVLTSMPAASTNEHHSVPVKKVQGLNLGGSPRTAPSLHYTLQLGSAATPDGLIASAQRHRLTNYTVYETVRYGRQWYVLVAGEYASLRIARQALNALPSEFLVNQPWVRQLAQVQAELQPE